MTAFWRSDCLPWPSDKNAVPNERIRENIRANMARDVPRFRAMPFHDGVFVYVGGGPSVNRYLDEIRERDDATVFTSGKTIGHLVRHGIVPWGYLNVDPKPHVAGYLDPAPDETRYFIASLSDPAMFDRLADRQVWMIHAPAAADDVELYQQDPEPVLIQGGTTTPLRAITLAYAMGYRQIEFYGVDSSFEDAPYAYDKATAVTFLAGEVETLDGRKFRTSPVWAQQVEEFDVQVAEWLEADHGLRFVFHGDGLLPHLMRLHNEPPAVIPEWKTATAQGD